MPGHRGAIAGGKMSPISGETVRRQNTADELACYLPFRGRQTTIARPPRMEKVKLVRSRSITWNLDAKMEGMRTQRLKVE